MRIYIDTSVFGGYFESEFDLWTRKLVEQILDGEHIAVVSDITLAELETAPAEVRNLSERIIAENAEFVIAGELDNDLTEKYLESKLFRRHSERMRCILPLRRLTRLMS